MLFFCERIANSVGDLVRVELALELTPACSSAVVVAGDDVSRDGSDPVFNLHGFLSISAETSVLSKSLKKDSLCCMSIEETLCRAKENPHTSYGAGFQAGIVNGVQALDAGYFLHSTSR